MIDIYNRLKEENMKKEIGKLNVLLFFNIG